ncbi:hypothetical protein DFJ58DRAFT_734500 [Suillus subalutaceus]|uniref:uncharacterized protein n=1 Tax=Suillus subalutaceus TaxID=48586 RepID=UPI001B868438|nr:uncharacterized protein DFJ58DRAFT_734500 [Suillus subalutaceus]KAG1837230.1 hypothetical protein DFJ58DRAFT_734500 [Suillus subalutaceus]
MARVLNTRQTRAKLTATQKAERRNKLDTLTGAIDNAKEAYAQEAVDIAQTHGRSLKWTHSQLFLKSRMSQQRQGVNSWNGFIKAKLREENEDRKCGDRIKLTQFIAENKDELLEAYSHLMFAEKRAYNTEAKRHDINATFTTMDHEWMALCARTGTEGFYVAVHGSIEDLSEPKVFFTQKVENFVKEVLHVKPRHLGLKLEAFVVSGLDENTIITYQCPLNKLVSDCRTIIQEELESIALEKNIKKAVQMNYVNYEHNIVEHCGVALVGWPLPGPVCNPSKVGGRAEVQKLLDALQRDPHHTESCHWVVLTDEELVKRMTENRARHARGETVYVARKKRKVMGQEHKSNATINTNTEDSDDTSSSDDTSAGDE